MFTNLLQFTKIKDALNFKKYKLKRRENLSLHDRLSQFGNQLVCMSETRASSLNSNYITVFHLLTIYWIDHILP